MNAKAADGPAPDRASSRIPRLAAASLWCENCGRETVHRVLRIRPSVSSTSVQGVARCRECRFTHPFESAGTRSVSVAAVVSTHAKSERRTFSLPTDLRIPVGAGLPDLPAGLVVRRIDRRGGGSVREARARDVETLWLAPARDTTLALSVIEGRTTRNERIPLTPGVVYEVGQEVRWGGMRLLVSALRARGHTWRRVGDRFPVEEVQRVYARRYWRPPAGSNDWSSERETPRSADRARSASARSRSSPGVRRNRTSPRARTARSGATDHRSSPS